ncbi:LuxR C-terminal-related transcriptional regulator [Persicobacter diffluens]|uniref:HTH luxR-type domain-containing protein n=1 Tax=Persicobacter diffluens TaxID=981 RepID=A0AAN4W5G5_9BACT|nr:hypothetical protein PEDI_52340 [Persicobacter diffluens]
MSFMQNLPIAQFTDWEKKYLMLYAKGHKVKTLCIMLNTSSSDLHRKRNSILEKTNYPTVIELIASIKRGENIRDKNIHQILSERECEVFELLRAGKSHKEIAETLFISKKTADAHISNIYVKLNIRNKIDLFNRY